MVRFKGEFFASHVLTDMKRGKKKKKMVYKIHRIAGWQPEDGGRWVKLH